MKTDFLKLTVPPLYLCSVEVLENALLSRIEVRVGDITFLEPDERGQIKLEYYMSPDSIRLVAEEISTLTAILRSISREKTLLLEQAAGFDTHAPTRSSAVNSPF